MKEHFAEAKDTILKSLDIMWKGCLAIFIVIGIIILAVWILNKTDSISKKKKAMIETKNAETKDNESLQSPPRE